MRTGDFVPCPLKAENAADPADCHTGSAVFAFYLPNPWLLRRKAKLFSQQGRVPVVGAELSFSLPRLLRKGGCHSGGPVSDPPRDAEQVP